MQNQVSTPSLPHELSINLTMCIYAFGHSPLTSWFLGASFDNNLILHIYIIIRKYYHTYFELIHAFYSWLLNNAE